MFPEKHRAPYNGCKNVQYVSMGIAPRVSAEEKEEWDAASNVRKAEKKLPAGLLLL